MCCSCLDMFVLMCMLFVVMNLSCDVEVGEGRLFIRCCVVMVSWWLAGVVNVVANVS